MISIQIQDPDGEDVLVLLRESDEHMERLYPLESIHRARPEDLRRPNVSFFIAREAGELLGCAALVRSRAAWAELKRMFVVPKARGRGIGRLLLQHIEKSAVAEGLSSLRLETGVHQPDAIALYQHAGFVPIAPFGDYGPDSLSIFLEKRLQPAA